MRAFPASSAALVLVALLYLPACKALFWSDTVNWQGGSWRGNDSFVEIQLEYETKASWNPLNQNARSRDYHTQILLHRFGDEGIDTEKIARYQGWTLNSSLFIAGNWAIAQRGLSDGYGTEDRELIAVNLLPADGATNEPVTLLKPEHYLIAAFPAPDGRRIVTVETSATMHERTGEVFLKFFNFADGRATPAGDSVLLTFYAAPGIPYLAWARDSSRLFIQGDESVQELAPGQAAPTPAARFPQCFRPTRSGQNISEDGRFFFRSQAGEIVTRPETWLAYDKIKMISRIDQIGAGCP